MEFDSFNEMFPSRSQQMLAKRVLEMLSRCPNLDLFEISEKLSPNKSESARMADCHRLEEHILKNLQAFRIITCKQGTYSLGENGNEALDLLKLVCKAKRKTAQIDPRKPKYVAFFCVKCRKPVGGRGTGKSATCTYCGCKNDLDMARIILRTNDSGKLRSTIEQIKLDRALVGNQTIPNLQELKLQSIKILEKKHKQEK